MNEVILIRRTPSTSVAIPTTTLQDARLSFRARGVLALLLTYDNDTLISTADLPSHGTEGRDALRTALAELREFSYVRQTRYPYQDDRGRTLWAWETVVSDSPLPSPENPSSVGSISPGNPSSERGLVTTPSTRREKDCDTPDISTTTEDGLSGFLSCTTTSCNSSSLLDTSYLKSSLQSAPSACSTPGWPDDVPEGKPKRGSKASRRAASAKANQDSTDAFESDLVGDKPPEPEPDPARQARVDQARRNKILAKRAEPPVSPAWNLAIDFSLAATEPDPEEPADRFGNRKELAANFARWRRDGASDEHIKDMIHEYWHGSFRRNLAAPAWKDFLASQDKIHAQLERRLKAEEVEANRYNPDYWA